MKKSEIELKKISRRERKIWAKFNLNKIKKTSENKVAIAILAMNLMNLIRKLLKSKYFFVFFDKNNSKGNCLISFAFVLNI